ncbi:MAG: tetratricopeptide repeat protein [Acidobacteriota bacterium]|nr:MAG: tetratricopeptide repeat protein [Acidobacteriota bacterium]
MKDLTLKTRNVFGRILLVAAVIAACAVAYFGVQWNFASAIAWRLDPAAPEAALLAPYLVEISPRDPTAHFFLAQFHEKSFEPGSEELAIASYRRAVELSPQNYVYRLALAKALSSAGEADAAAAEYERTIELAPNNSNVQWVYGNFLIRQGRSDEGFRMISAALYGNDGYAMPAITLAMQIFEGDLSKLRNALGGSDNLEMALAYYLVNDKRYDDAMAAWQTVVDRGKTEKTAMFSESLADRFIGARRFAPAAVILNNLNGKPVAEAGAVNDPGFEAGVKMRDAGTFEWQIGKGAEPQITLTESGVRSGRYSLLIIFNSFATADFREVSQIVLAEPNMVYEFEAWYRSDLKTDAKYYWEVTDATAGALLARTAALAPSAEWAPAKASFKLPAGGDAVILRFVRDGCVGPTCPTAGRIAFDDITLRKL